MVKSELVKAVSLQSGLSPKDSREAVDAVFESISQSLESGSRVELRGFGSFGLKNRQPRVGRNPKTGEIVDISPKRVMFFKAGKELRKRVDS